MKKENMEKQIFYFFGFLVNFMETQDKNEIM